MTTASITDNETCARIVDAETARYAAEALMAPTPEAALRAWQGVYRSYAVASAIRALVPRYTGLSHGSPGRWPDDDDDGPDRDRDPEPDPNPTPDGSEMLARLFNRRLEDA